MSVASVRLRSAAELGGWCWLRVRGALSPEARAQRVAMLLAATLAMAVGDLYMTLMFVTHGGMLETNPVARMVMALNSTTAVIVWKLATTLLGLGILFHLRRLRLGEMGAWAVFVALSALSMHWLDYSQESASICPELQVLSQAHDERFVTIDP